MRGFATSCHAVGRGIGQAVGLAAFLALATPAFATPTLVAPALAAVPAQIEIKSQDVGVQDSMQDRAGRRVETPARPRPKLTPAIAKTTRHKVSGSRVSVKMDTVLRCENGVCLQVSTKTAVSGSAPVED